MRQRTILFGWTWDCIQEDKDQIKYSFMIMVPQTFQPYILSESHNAVGHNGVQDCTTLLKDTYYLKKVWQHCNKYVRSCPECQQVTLKEPYYVDLHLQISQFHVLISMDLFNPYCKLVNGNQYALLVICMLTNYVFMILIKSKTTEHPIQAYLKNVYSIFRGSKYILSDREGKIISKQFTWLAEELGFIKVYTFPHTLTGNLVIEHTHSFLKASLWSLICNDSIDWNELTHVALMGLQCFPTPSGRRSSLLLNCIMSCFYIYTVQTILPIIRYMGDEGCKIKLDAIREIYMMAVLSLKTARDECTPQI